MGKGMNWGHPRGTNKSKGFVDDGVRSHGPRANRRGKDRDFWTVERDAKLVYVMEKYGDIYKAARVLGVPPFRATCRLKLLVASGQMERKFYGTCASRAGRGPVDYEGDGGKKKRLTIIRQCAERLKTKQEKQVV